MKKILFIVILVTGIALEKHAYAQSNSGQVFDIPAEKFTRVFTIELERKNKMQVSVTSMQVMDYINNIDSIVKVFLNELSTIRDSLPTKAGGLRLDYNVDNSTIKKLRVRKNILKEDYYAFIDGSPSLLKMRQDTVIIHGKIPADWLRRSKKFKTADYAKYYFSVTFYLNELEDLLAYKDGRLNEKMMLIRQHYRDKWLYRDDDRMEVKGYPEITSNTAKGYIFRYIPFMIKKSVEVQNYKNHFIPSISCTPVFIKEDDFKKREFGINIEAAFSFENMLAAKTKTHVNVFAGLSYHVIPLSKTSNLGKIHPDISISYLVNRKDQVYDKNTFRLGFASFSTGNLTTRIQPAIYFNNFFKKITPSLRIIQSF